ncbi:MAG: NAD(P)H-dependent oxidoreductase [Bacteroidota bacterium]
MITVFSGSNRRNSKTSIFAKYFHELLSKSSKEEVHFFSLEDLPLDICHAEMYSPKGQSKALAAIQDKYLIPVEKFLFVFPEYNGSFPGALKLMIDACSIREYKPTFKGKKAGLVGTASGRAGNLRGMDHLTGVLHHVGTQVMPNKLPISSIEQLLDGDQLVDEGAIKTMTQYVEQFLAF